MQLVDNSDAWFRGGSHPQLGLHHLSHELVNCVFWRLGKSKRANVTMIKDTTYYVCSHHIWWGTIPGTSPLLSCCEVVLSCVLGGDEYYNVTLKQTKHFQKERILNRLSNRKCTKCNPNLKTSIVFRVSNALVTSQNAKPGDKHHHRPFWSSKLSRLSISAVHNHHPPTWGRRQHSMPKASSAAAWMSSSACQQLVRSSFQDPVIPKNNLHI